MGTSDASASASRTRGRTTWPCEHYAGRVEVQEIATGLWRWTAWHEEWKADVGCVYYESGGSVCLIDPLVPESDADRFWAALDRDVARAAGVDVLITVFW